VLEGTGEGAERGVFQDSGDLAERQIGLGEQHAGDLKTNLIGYLPVGAAVGLQAPVQGPAGQQEQVGDRTGRTTIPDEFDSKHTTHILG
jgi:hypothetical protein